MTAAALILPAGAQLSPTAQHIQDARAEVGQREQDAHLKLTAQLYAGQQWAGGLGWSGPLPKDTAEGAARVLAEISRAFVSRNMVRDVVQRHQAGVAGREPLWSFAARDGSKLDEAQKGKADEFTAALTDWWDSSGAWLAVQQAIRTALWSGRGTLRIFIPKRNTKLRPDGSREIPREPLADVIHRLAVHAPDHAQAGWLRDDDDQPTAAYYRYQERFKPGERWEIQEVEDDAVIVRPDVGAAGSDLTAPNQYPTGGAFLIYEICLDPLITESVITQQKLSNLALTMLSRNVELGGFTERTILNAQLPGKYVKDADAPNGKRFVPSPYLTGAGVTQFLAGIQVKQMDDKGNMVPTGQFSTPNVIYKDPVAVTTFTETYNAAREALLDEVKQLHILISGDASASGVSRQQAVNDFVSSLEPTRMALEQAVRWLLGTVLKLALYFAGREGELDDYRLRTQARLSAVQPTSAEVDTALKLHSEGAISRESMYGRIGVEDADAETATINAEGVTPTLAFALAALGVPAWVKLQVLSLAFPALKITEEEIAAQREADTPSAQTGTPDDATRAAVQAEYGSGQKDLGQLAAKYGVPVLTISNWVRAADGGPGPVT